MSREVVRRRIYKSRAVRRRRSALAVAVAVALTLVVIVTAQGARPKPVRVKFDRRAAAAYADAWALDVNPGYWSSPDSDCANFVSQCLAAGGLRPTCDDGREWRANGTALPTTAWVNCGAQKQAFTASGALHTRYVVEVTRTLPPDWAAGDIVYLGNLEHGKVVWEHVIICAGRRGGEWVYDSHTTALKGVPLGHWYPAHFTAVRFCRVADAVVYRPQ
jgi:hypothetical protein